VLTLLPAPATIRLPGRGTDGGAAEYEAPAGLFVRQFPLVPGELSVELQRHGQTLLQLHAPEPITDKPFRMDNTLQCVSSMDQQDWQEDFPGAPYPRNAEYADNDGDGLPNWFEMYWFGVWGDYSTATSARPQDDPDHDHRTNLQEFQARTDPTQRPAQYTAGATWDIRDVFRQKVSFNPDQDSQGTSVWFYLYRMGNAPIDEAGPYLPATVSSLPTLLHASPNDIEEFKDVGGSISWESPDQDHSEPRLKLRPRNKCLMALAWQSPVAGQVDIAWKVAPVSTQDGITLSIWNSASGEQLWSRAFHRGDDADEELRQIAVHPGDRILFVADSQPGTDAYESLKLEQLTIKWDAAP